MHWSFRRLMKWKILVAQQQEGLASLTSEKWNKIKISLVLCLCFVDRCLSFCTFPFGHYVVCPSIYGLWIPLWYLQTLLKTDMFCLLWDYCPSGIIIVMAIDVMKEGSFCDSFVFFWGRVNLWASQISQIYETFVQIGDSCCSVFGPLCSLFSHWSICSSTYNFQLLLWFLQHFHALKTLLS